MMKGASFQNGRHVKAARAMAGLRQSDLAALAGLHVNSIKRLEGLRSIPFRDHAASRVAEALRAQGVIAGLVPMPLVRLAQRLPQMGGQLIREGEAAKRNADMDPDAELPFS